MFDASSLWADASIVISLRFWRMVADGPAGGQRETQRMVEEKAEAWSELACALAGGSFNSPQAAARKALNVYGRRVRGNRRRLGTRAAR
jgi:hypothetical protein